MKGVLANVYHRDRAEKNLGKYLALSSKEDIYITRNGTVVAKLSNPFQDRVDMAKSLFGILPPDITAGTGP